MDKRSPIWKFFKICDDETKAQCQLCNTVISRGGSSTKSFTTTPLNNHLSYKHPDEYKQIIKQKAAASASASSTSGIQQTGGTQQTLSDVINKKKKWSIDSPEAQKVHRSIGKMIAVDIQPYSIVDDSGFKELIDALEPRYVLPSRKFFSEKIIPEMYDTVKGCVQTALSKAKFVCLTTDTWTAQTTTTSFLSLTAHWIDEKLTRQAAVLHCQKFDGQHTGSRLADALLDMMNQWNIEKQRVHLVIRDGGANMVKAIRDADLPSVSCFAHTLQLALHDSILTQPSVADLIALSRKIVGHFKHSSSATTSLHAIQEQIGLPKHQLHQDVVTRWNSTYQMLERLIEQKRAVSLYIAECDEKNKKALTLTTSQWVLATRIVAILQPFEQLTREISGNNSCFSVILPAVQAILLYVQKDVCDEGIKKTVSELVASMTRRFSDLYENSLYAVSAGLDPRFKLRFLTNVQQLQAKTDIVTATLNCQSSTYTATVQTSEVFPAADEELPAKKMKPNDFWTSWDQLQPVEAQNSDIQVTIETEVNNYLSEPCIPRDTDPLDWWKINMSRFPTLVHTVKRYLCAPPTSVPSERLFSTAGNTFSETRSCLNADNMERLVLLKANAAFMH